MNIRTFIRSLKNHQSENVFNPYRDICKIHDRFNAAGIRRSNLSQVLTMFSHMECDAVWIGRDLGHRGGRRTGLAFTDDVQLPLLNQLWQLNLRRATKGKPVHERSASNIWAMAERLPGKIFMWNVFPFHPFHIDNPLSNRAHTASEREIGKAILDALIGLLNPNKLIAIGNDAYQCSKRMFPNQRVYKIRHPSYGGEKIFCQQIENLYRLPKI